MNKAATLAMWCCFVMTGFLQEAHAASFDCSNANSQRERLICRDAALSDADSKLGNLYQKLLSQLSPSGAELLRRSQRNWLAYANRTCPLTGRDNRYGETAKCLRSRYDERVRNLSKVGEQIGPFRFLRIDIYTLKVAKDRSGSAPGFFVRHVAYPQIDDPGSQATIAWNKRQVRKSWPGGCDEFGDANLDFDIGYANDRFISLQWNEYSYCHGTPHGTFRSAADNVILQPGGMRPATAEDIFGGKALWREPLQALFWDAILAQGWKARRPAIEDQLKDEILKPNRWLFIKDGLHFDFDAYEGGCYVCNPEPLTLSWERLKPLLATKGALP